MLLPDNLGHGPGKAGRNDREVVGLADVAGLQVVPVSGQRLINQQGVAQYCPSQTQKDYSLEQQGHRQGWVGWLG